MTRKPIFWILLVLGVSVGGCCLFSVAILGLGAMAGDSPAAATVSPSTSSAGKWKVAGEIARGSSFTQALSGGRWVAQYGSNVDMVVARAGATQWVQTNTSGYLYELVFDDDGTYVLSWVSALTMDGMRYNSHCTEQGSWSLSGTQLTLTPDSQAATYSNGGRSQDKTDEDLGARRYEVLDLTLEADNVRFPGMLMSGRKAAWDTRSGSDLNLTLQRLAD